MAGWQAPRSDAPITSSATNADDRLPSDPLGWVEGSNGIVEGRYLADVGPQAAVAHSPGDLTQLRAIGHDNEVDGQTADWPCRGRTGDRHQHSSGSNNSRGPLPDAGAEDVEHQIDDADIFQCVVLKVDELLRTEVERCLPVGC